MLALYIPQNARDELYSQTSLQPGRNPHVHQALVGLDIRRGSPFPSPKRLITSLVQALLPDLDERIVGGRVRRQVDHRRPMVRVIDDVVARGTVVVVPVEGEKVTRLDLDGVGDLFVAQDVAAHVDAVEVFDGGVGVSSRRGPIVGGCADAAEGSLVDAVYEYALGFVRPLLLR